MIADDHDLVRQGLRALLDLDSALEVVGEAINGAEAVRLAHRLRPDVVETAAPGTLVLSDVIYPAWHARVDDASRDLRRGRRAAGCHRAPRQAHGSIPVCVRRALGAAITGLTLLVLVCAAVRLKRRW